MTFRRTANGLSNQHAFLKANAMVFLEGGASLSKEDVYEGNFNANEIDIQYWKGIFSIFKGENVFEFRSIGSKTTLRSIVEDVRDGAIQNVYVAMDRDFDCYKGEIIDHENVIYTHGYSWENDVWKPEVVFDVYKSIAIINKDIDSEKTKVFSIYNSFIEDIREAVKAEIFLCDNEVSVIPRAGHLCCLDFGKKVKPVVNCGRIDGLLQSLNLDPDEFIKFDPDNEIDIQANCYGHLMADFSYCLIVYCLNKIWKKTPKIAKYFINCLGIDKFMKRLTEKKYDYLFAHFESAFA